MRSRPKSRLAGGARCADGGRGGPAWILCSVLARALGAEGDAPKNLIRQAPMPAVVDALADPAVRQRLADVGQELYPREQQTPEALRALPGGQRPKKLVADHQGRETIKAD